MQSYFIKSEFFKVEPGEDAETNPGVYGREFSSWLAAELRKRGIAAEEAIPEDFGWCVVLQRKPSFLWVACGNREGSTSEWGAYVVSEPSFFQRIFGRAAPANELERINSLVAEIVKSAPGGYDFSVE